MNHNDIEKGGGPKSTYFVLYFNVVVRHHQSHICPLQTTARVKYGACVCYFIAWQEVFLDSEERKNFSCAVVVIYPLVLGEAFSFFFYAEKHT